MQKPESREELKKGLLKSIFTLTGFSILFIITYFNRYTCIIVYYNSIFFGISSLIYLLATVLYIIEILQFKQETYLEKLDEYREFKKKELRKEMSTLGVEINNI